MCRHGDANTWSVEMRCEGASASVNVTSVRDFIERYGLPTPTYVKVDVEGGEWAGSLLDGLASLRVPLLSFEYAVGWSPRLFGLQRPLMAAERGSVAHTLHRFEQKLDERGYDTFLASTAAATESLSCPSAVASGMARWRFASTARRPMARGGGRMRAGTT